MSKRKLRRIVISLLIFGIGLLISHYSQVVEKTTSVSVNGSYPVTQIFDGDTIEVNMDGNKEKVRFIGVDTPETHDPRKSVQCFGKTAHAFTVKTIGNSRVRLESDPKSTDRDRYNRLLRYVYTDSNILINSEIIKQGYGFAYTGFEFTKSDEFKRLQQEARDRKLGLWSDCTPRANEYGGFTSNDEKN